MGGNVNQELRELREQVQNLADVMQHKIKETVDEKADEAKEAADNILHFNREDLMEMARKAGKDLRSFLAERRTQAEEVYDAAEKRITSHPFQSIATAISGGLLLGMLMRRK